MNEFAVLLRRYDEEEEIDKIEILSSLDRKRLRMDLSHVVREIIPLRKILLRSIDYHGIA